MSTFLVIMAVTPWSLLAIIVYRFLRKTKVYGNIWMVTERYLDAFEYRNEPEGSDKLIFVKQTEIDHKEMEVLYEPLEAQQDRRVDQAAEPTFDSEISLRSNSERVG